MNTFMKLNRTILIFSTVIVGLPLCLLLVSSDGVSAEFDRQAVQKELEMLKQRISSLEQLLQQRPEKNEAIKKADEHKMIEQAMPVAKNSNGAVAKEKGAIEISTSGSTMTIGGEVRVDAVFNNPTSSSNFVLRSSAIASSTAAQDERGHFSMQARESRFWFKTNTPINGDALRTLIEIDFRGSVGNERVTNSHNIRLRHAYAKYAGFTFGQTNSTFMHSGTTPDLIDDPTSEVLVRQPLIRYTYPFDNGDFQISLEQPETTLTDILGARITPDDDRLPDLAAKYSWSPGWGKISISGVLRQLRIDSGGTAIGGVPAGVTDQAVGGALFASAKINLWGANNIRLGSLYGNAVGRYVSYNSFNAAMIDSAGNIHLQRTLAGFVALQHWWDDNWHSSIVFSRSQINNDLNILPVTVYNYFQSYHANLLWAPLLNTSMGIEYIYATSKKENGEKGLLQRIKFSAIYKF